MKRTWIIELLLAAAVAAEARAQTVSRDAALPRGVYRMGRVVRAKPLTIDLGSGDGLAKDANVTLLSVRHGTTLGVLTVARAEERESQGTVPPGTVSPSAGDLAAFRTAAEIPPEGEEPPAPLGKIVRTLAKPQSYALAVPRDALVSVGQNYPLTGPDGKARTMSVRSLGAAEAEVFVPGPPLAVGTVVPLPSRLKIVRPSGTAEDPLIGKTVLARFREVPKGEATSYFRGTIARVDRARADGPVPCFTAEFETGKGKAAWQVMPKDVQHVVILENVPARDRDQALALWEAEKKERLAPHRLWEQMAKVYIRLKDRGQTPSTKDLEPSKPKPKPRPDPFPLNPIPIRPVR